MRDKLIQYIDLLFAGRPDADDTKQEILQNTLDRYDDLIDQGKSPEAAYSLSIAGIGDIDEILHCNSSDSPMKEPAVTPKKKVRSAWITAVAIMLFILCPVPVILFQDTIGLCLLFIMIAAGVGLLITNNSDNCSEKKATRSSLHKILLGIAWGCGIAGFLSTSLLTGAWYITWLFFPITICTCGLVNAIFDLNKVFLNAVIRIVIFSVLVIVLLVSLLGGYLAVNRVSFIDEHYTQSSGNIESAGSVAPDMIKDISIEWVSGSVTIQPGDVQDIQFYEDSGLKQEHKMVWKQEADCLKIQYCKPKVTISLFGNTDIPSKNLVITVPRDWLCSSIEIDSVSAEIFLESLNAYDAEIVNVSGRSRVYQCNISSIDLDTVSGDVIFEGQTDSLELASVSANCTAKLNNNPKDVDLETVSGDLCLILPQDCGFTMSLDSVSGELMSDFPTTMHNKRYTYGNGVCKISADTVSGDILIKLPE